MRCGAGAAHGVHHDEQFHQVLVRRRRRGLHDVDILAADVLLDLDEGLSVREGLDGGGAERDSQVLTDGLGEDGMRGAGQDLQFVVHCPAVTKVCHERNRPVNALSLGRCRRVLQHLAVFREPVPALSRAGVTGEEIRLLCLLPPLEPAEVARQGQFVAFRTAAPGPARLVSPSRPDRTLPAA